jgi:branched-chain amino acid aminotransferase
MPVVLAEHETQDQGDLPLLRNDRGDITEGSSASVSMVVNGLLRTPRASDVFEGVTRAVVIEFATEAGIELSERDLSMYDVTIASEI